MNDALADHLLEVARAMAAEGLNRGTAGNASLRLADGMLITPSGLHWNRCEPGDMVQVDRHGRSSGPLKPSSEWRIHHDLYAARPEVGAILHAHSPFATALACHARDIPAFHYMIARFGGADVRCARYQTFGTQALSDSALTALAGRSACLLANHGMLVLGREIDQALALAIEFETLCEHYLRACQLGPPVILDAAEMQRVIERFAAYGQQAA